MIRSFSKNLRDTLFVPVPLLDDGELNNVPAFVELTF